MAKINNREDALLQAYLGRYKTAQGSTVTGGQQAAQTAQKQGSAILNATDKTLPSLGNPYESALKNIVSGSATENSLNLNFLNRQVKLAKAQYDAAQDYAKQMEKAQSYAAKAAKRSNGKGNTAGQSNSTDLSDAAASALNGLNSSSTNANSTKPSSNNTTNNQKKPSAQEQYLADKASGKRKAVTGNSYAERVSAAQPAQSRAVTKGGKVIGSSYVAAGSAPSASERTAAKDKRNDYKSQQEDIATALKKLQSDADYRAELAAPGRKLTSAEVAAVNQYEKSTKNTGFSGLKRVFDLAKNSDNLSKEEYAKESAELNAELNQNSALRGKAQLNGAGQSAQAFTAGLYDSVPFLSKASDAMASAANATGLGAELPMLSKTLEDTKTYDPLAATAGTMVGKGMQYNLFNTAMAGTPLAQAMGKAGNAIVGQAQKIPVLGGMLGAGAGDALGRILTDTTADLALDTLPSLVSDVSEGKSAGEVAGNTAKNIAGNVAMNALPEIGGAAFNWLNGAQEKEAEQLRRAVLQRQQEIGDEAKRALQNSDSLSIDAAADTGYNGVNSFRGVTNEAVQGRSQYDGTGSEGILRGGNSETTQPETGLAVGAASGEYLPANRVLVAEHLNQRPSVYDDSARAIAEQAAENSANLPIDSNVQKGYNGVINDGGAQNGTEINVGRSVEGTEPGGAGSGAADVQGTGRNANGNQGVFRQPVIDDVQRQAIESTGASWGTMQDMSNDPETFVKSLDDAIANNKHGLMVSPKAVEDLQQPGTKVFMTEDRRAGAIVTADGDIEAVHKNPDSRARRASTQLMITAIENGGNKLDCYGADLVRNYNFYGFEPVAKVKWNPDYAPDGWTYGAKDVYVMKLQDGVDTNTVLQRFGKAEADGGFHIYNQAELDALPTMEYDEALAYRDSLLKTPSAMTEGVSVMPDTAKGAAQSLPLNGSESVHPNTVGSKEREMPYQEYVGRGHSVADIDRNTLTPENQNILGTNEPYTVQRVSHAEQQANAQQIRSNEGLSATIDRIVKDSTSGNFNDETETLAGNTLRELNEKLNTLETNTAEYARTATQARIVRSKMREGLTKTARTLESAKQFTTPEKAVMNVEGILNDARDAAQKKNPGAFKKAQTAIENAVEDGRNEANAQLGEIVTNELSKIVETGKQIAGNGNAGKAARAAKELPVLDNPEDVWARAVARKTGNYAQDNLKKADPDDLFAKEIVNQLFETAKESPVAQGARVKNGYTAQAKLNLAFDAQDDYAAVWNKARAIAQKNYKNNPDMTSRLQSFFDNVKDEGSLYSNKTVLTAFTENLKENDDTFRQLADRAAFGNKSEISKAANRLADAVEVPDAYRSSFLKTAESVLANSKQLTGAQAHADGRAFRAALNRAGFTVGDIADASAFGNDISPVMAAHEIMETLNPPTEYRQTVFDNVYNYIKNNDGYQKQTEKADSRVLRRLVNNVDGGYTSIANKAAFGSDAGMQATVSDFLDAINAPTSLRSEMGERLQKAITGNAQYQKAAAGADSRVFNEAVRHVQEELEFTFQKLSGESDASKAKVLDGLKDTITDYLGVDDTQAADVVQNIEKMYNSALSDGAMKRLAQIFPDTGKAANAPRDQFLELLRSGAYNDEYMGEAVKDLAATKFGIQQLSDEQVANIKQLAEQMETLPKDSKTRVDIENEIASIASGNVRGSFWDKWNAMRYTGMLFNAVTNIKNAVNNVGQGTLALLKDGVNGAVQRVAKAMGNETADVTVGYLNPASKADRSLIGRAFADTENSRWRQLTGASEHFEMAKAARNAGQTFDTRVMRTIDQMSSAMLEDADVYGTSGLLSFAKPLSEKNPLRKAAEFAQDATKSMGENGFIGVAGLKNNYSRYLASYLKAHGATDAIFDATDEASKAMLEQARDYAVQQALVNTYHEANVLTDFIGSAKKSANKVPLLGAWVEGQLPFVKTPTNVGIQAWRYSPGGLLQGIAQIGYDAAKGKDINKAMDTFSAGLTGSAIAGLGAYLWSTGHLVPGMTDEEKAEADLTGAQENSLQFTDENGKLHSYTINWLSNWAGPMMVGANLAKMWDTRNDNSTGVVDKVLNACVSVLDPVIDSSYLTGLNNTIDQLGNAQTGGEKAATLLTSGFGNYFTQAIPTLSGQLARTIDPTRRSTYTGLTGAAKNFAYFGQKSENKIPVLSKSNEPYIDVWGNEEKNFTPASGESASDYAARSAYNFLSPGYYSESDDDAVSQYVEGLYKSTGDKNVLPKNSSARGYTVSVQSPDGGDSMDHRLTPQEKAVYDKTYGQTAYDIVDSLRQNSMFLRLPEDQQSEIVQDAYSVAKTVGGVAAVGDGVSGTNSKAYQAYEQGGIPMLENYLLADNAIKDADATKKADVAKELLNSGLDSEGIYNSYILKYPKDQKAPAVYSQYGADGARNWLRYQAAADIDGNGRISQDEARAVLDAMNLTDAQRSYYYLLTNSGWSAKNNPYGGA